MENILFENKYEITPRLTKKWNSLSFKRIGRHRLWVRLAMTLIFAALAVLCIVMNILTSTQGYLGSNTYFGLSVIFGSGFMVSAFMPRYINKIRYKNYLKFSCESNWIQTIRFGEKSETAEGVIEVSSGNSVTTYALQQINYADENDECIILWINNFSLLMVYKNAFTIGNTDDFRLWLYECLGDGGILWTKKKLKSVCLKKQLPRIILLVILAVCVPLGIFMNPYRYSRNHTNKNGTVERNYQKDMDTIYFAQWDMLRTQEDTDGYKIDLKNNAFYFIGSGAAHSKDNWGTEQGDTNFRFIGDLENDAIDAFFRQTARNGFTNWEERYEDKNILDGSEWYVKIVFSDGTSKEISGVNKYPETWKHVITDFENLTGYQFK